MHAVSYTNHTIPFMGYSGCKLKEVGVKANFLPLLPLLPLLLPDYATTIIIIITACARAADHPPPSRDRTLRGFSQSRKKRS